MALPEPDTTKGTPEGVRLALLDVGHGCAAVAFGGKEAVLFDCPPGTVLPRFLRRHGIAVVRHLIISHAHKDHMGGVASLISSGVAVEHIWLLDDQVNPTIYYGAVQRAFASARTEGNRALRREYPHSDVDPVAWASLTIEFLGPNHEDRMTVGDANTLSVVSRLVHRANGVALFPGDLTWSGFEPLDRDRDWSADWLIAAHHGGSCGSAGDTGRLMSELLSLTRAKDVFFSFSRDKFDLPLPEAVDAIKDHRLSVYIRCSQLSKVCSPDLRAPRKASGMISQGAKSIPLKCCAGSIMITLTDEGSMWPGSDSHDSLVRHFPNRLCRDSGGSP